MLLQQSGQDRPVSLTKTSITEKESRMAKPYERGGPGVADKSCRPAGAQEDLRQYNQKCAGKVEISIDVRIDTREMSSWTAEPIGSLFAGIAAVERAMAGLPCSVDDPPADE